MPLTPILVADRIELIGHLAIQNPFVKLESGSDVQCVFLGNHTYISPTWYPEGGVPTWNYSAVQVHGTLKWIHDQDANKLIECLEILTTHLESIYPSSWKFELPDDLPKEVLSKSIRGFRIKVQQIEYKKKLSQNRSKDAIRGVIQGLQLRATESLSLGRTDQASAVARDMIQEHQDSMD